MDIQAYIELAKRVESIARRVDTFAHSREDVLEELGWLAKDLRKAVDQADDLNFHENFKNEELISTDIEMEINNV
jgi:hypothetical protein